MFRLPTEVSEGESVIEVGGLKTGKQPADRLQTSSSSVVEDTKGRLNQSVTQVTR